MNEQQPGSAEPMWTEAQIRAAWDRIRIPSDDPRQKDELLAALRAARVDGAVQGHEESCCLSGHPQAPPHRLHEVCTVRCTCDRDFPPPPASRPDPRLMGNME